MNKKWIALLSSAFIVFSTACGGGEASSSSSLTDSEQTAPTEYTLVTPDELAGVNSFGVSVEFDPHFLSQNVAKGVTDPQDWAIVEERVAKMEIDRFRVMLLPSWLEPFNDNEDVADIDWDSLTVNSAEMQSVYKVLDLAEENGIDVNLTLWGAENKCNLIDADVNAAVKAQGGHFLMKNNEGSNWVLGTQYPAEFAENFSMYVQHFLEKGYTCIKEITPVNEPDWSYQINRQVSFDTYKTLCLELDKRFKADGIRDKVLFNLSDNTNDRPAWLEQTMMELDDIADVYNTHSYAFGYESTNEQIMGWEQENRNVTRNTGKAHIVGEFGSNLVTGSSRQSDIDEYRRGVLMVRQMLNFYNGGAAGASYWVLCDEYYNYGDTYDSMMQLGLWKCSKRAYYTDTAQYEAIKEDYEVRPQYYAYALMSKYVPKGAEVYPIFLNDDFAVGTAFKGTDGKWVYVFANGNAEGEALKLKVQASGTFEKYVYEENALPKGDALIAACEETALNTISFALAPQTVVLWREK